MSETPKELQALVRPVTDTLYVLNGKWKLPILIMLTDNDKRFGELADDLAGITDRMLSRELKELEANLLVCKKKAAYNPAKVVYAITEHGRSLHNVVLELSKWGTAHRKLIAS
ncbi:MAG: helix-turn-helix transcriptional regulator [Bacteroidota bacterium]|nr:helix-turn-helix transcriptional regulator [Bacteroidota bacterium]